MQSAARAAHPSLNAELARGAYATLFSWLRLNVHTPGRRFSAPGLMRHATGEPTDAKYHLEYLRAKFLA